LAWTCVGCWICCLAWICSNSGIAVWSLWMSEGSCLSGSAKSCRLCLISWYASGGWAGGVGWRWGVGGLDLRCVGDLWSGRDCTLKSASCCLNLALWSKSVIETFLSNCDVGCWLYRG
jgi:hypothetical protein